MKSKTDKPLSELEGVSLGIVQALQPCTAYQVRGELKGAPSSHWRASAGSIYPLLSRLEKRGLLTSVADDADGRGKKLLQITAAGKQAIRRWILAGTDADLISSLTDPVRSRMFFLQALAPKQRRDYLDRMIRRLEDYHIETQEHLNLIDVDDDPFNYLGALGGTMSAAARLEWLREVRKRLTG